MRNIQSFVLLLLLATPAAASPPKGAFKVTSVKDAKQTVVIEDMFKKAKTRGEYVVEFDGDTITIGVWVLSKATDAKFPNQALMSVCRGAAITTTKWTGDSFTLASGVEVKGWGDSYLITRTKKGDETTVQTWTGGAGCNFGLEALTYKVTAAGDKLTLTSPLSTMQLVRTTAVANVDTQAAAKDFAKP